MKHNEIKIPNEFNEVINGTVPESYAYQDHIEEEDKYIQSKNKRPLLAYILSEIIYNVNLLIGRRLVVQEFNKLDFKKIRSYYKLYGEDATLKNFKLSKQVLDKILY